MPGEGGTRRASNGVPSAVLLVCWVLLAAGCDAPSSDVDAGSDAGDAGVTVDLALPSWGACPEGWAPSDVEGASICVPPARVACSGASFQPIGRAACEPVDDGCTGSRFREARATDRTAVFVDPAATPGGDGSESAPYANIDEALRAGATGILLAQGDYSITAALPTDLDVRGVCADRVRILALADRPAIEVNPGRRAALMGVTVTGSGLGPFAGGTLILDRVVIEAIGGWGIVVDTGVLEARRVSVRTVRPTLVEGAGAGIVLFAGAMARLTDVVIEDTQYVGISLDGSASLEGDRVVVEEVRPDDTGAYGGGIGVSNGSSLVLHASRITDVQAFGISVHGDSSLSLDAVVVGGVGSRPSDPVSTAITMAGSTATLSRLLLEDVDGVGLLLFDTAVVRASDLLVRRIQVMDGFASGILFEGGALELDRAMLLDTAYVGVYLRGGALDARDLVIRRVPWAPNAGSALVCLLGGVATVTRFSFTDLSVRGAAAVGEGARLTLERGEIRRVDEGPEQDIGRAIEAMEGGQAFVRSVVIDDVVETAIMAIGITEVGTLVPGTRIELDDVRITGIHERPCARTTCPTEGGGSGVASLYGATLVADALSVTGAPLCGVQVVDRSELDVRSGTIETCAIGACVAIEGYDLGRIVTGTRFVDNERNVETVGVYVPRVGPSF